MLESLLGSPLVAGIVALAVVALIGLAFWWRHRHHDAMNRKLGKLKGAKDAAQKGDAAQRKQHEAFWAARGRMARRLRERMRDAAKRRKD